MTSELRKKLDNAEGTSDNIIALILDIRGFTPFCTEQESINVANFIKRVYIRIIDDYFPEASFYKPTGDGLLIVIPYTAKSLRDLLVKTVEKSLNLLRDFGKLCDGDDMIYFATPNKVGIGISRGLACRISSGETILDYSGRVINLASRMNNLARPSGIVFDSKFGLSLLQKEIQELFLSDNVYIRGIADDKPMAIDFTKQYTIISPSNKVPLKEPKMLEVADAQPYGALKELLSSNTEGYLIELEHTPVDEKQITLEIRYYTGRDKPEITFLLTMSSEGVGYIRRGKKNYLDIELPVLMKYLAKSGLKDSTEVRFEVCYPVA